MPEKDKQSVEQKNGAKKESKPPAFDFADLSTAEEYLEWKQNVPSEIRRMVEAATQGKKAGLEESGLRLTNQFLRKLSESLIQGQATDLKGADKRVANLLSPLGRVKTKGGYLNLFETLANPDVSWNLKTKIYETQLKTALDWLVGQDLKELAEKLKQKEATPPEIPSPEIPSPGVEEEKKKKRKKKKMRAKKTLCRRNQKRLFLLWKAGWRKKKANAPGQCLKLRRFLAVIINNLFISNFLQAADFVGKKKTMNFSRP